MKDRVRTATPPDELDVATRSTPSPYLEAVTLGSSRPVNRLHVPVPSDRAFGDGRNGCSLKQLESVGEDWQG